MAMEVLYENGDIAIIQLRDNNGLDYNSSSGSDEA
jgi:hypothetical protein